MELDMKQNTSKFQLCGRGIVNENVAENNELKYIDGKITHCCREVDGVLYAYKLRDNDEELSDELNNDIKFATFAECNEI